MIDKRITFPRLREVLDSVNPNVVKEVCVIPNTCGSGPINTFTVKLGYSSYDIWVADVDDRYTLDGINLFSSILRDYDLNYIIKPTRYSLRCNDYIYDINRIHDDF